MEKFLRIWAIALVFIVSGCVGDDTTPEFGSAPTPAPDGHGIIVTLTQNAPTYTISYSEKGVDGQTRYFNATLSLFNPRALSTNHYLAKVESIASIADINDIPQSGWSNSWECVKSHGYVVQIVANNANSNNSGAGTMYVRMHVIDTSVNRQGVVTSAKIQLETAWRFYGFTPSGSQYGPEAYSGTYEWTRKVDIQTEVSRAHPDMFVIGDNLYLFTGGYDSLWRYDMTADEWTQKKGVTIPPATDESFISSGPIFGYVEDDAIHLWLGYTKTVALYTYRYRYAIMRYDTTIDEWSAVKTDMVYSNEDSWLTPVVGEPMRVAENKAFPIGSGIYVGNLVINRPDWSPSISNADDIPMPGKSTRLGDRIYYPFDNGICEFDTSADSRLDKLTVEGMSQSIDVMFAMSNYVYVRDDPNTTQLTVKYDPVTNSYEDITIDIGWPYGDQKIVTHAVVGNTLYVIFDHAELWAMTLK
jgi:hypothetical protein